MSQEGHLPWDPCGELDMGEGVQKPRGCPSDEGAGPRAEGSWRGENGWSGKHVMSRIGASFAIALEYKNLIIPSTCL